MFVPFQACAIKSEAETDLTSKETFRFTIQDDVDAYIRFIAIHQLYEDGSCGGYKRLWYPEKGKKYICNFINHAPPFSHKLRFRLTRIILAAPLSILVETYGS